MSVLPLNLPARSRPRLDLPLRTTLALWWLAIKRNGGWLLLPLIAGVMGWLVWTSQLERGVVLWMPTVQGIGYTLAVAGPVTAALASWVAGRGHRRTMNDLLATAPLPRGWSVVAEWLGVTAWALVIYLSCATLALAWTATEATWGRPLLSPILVAAVALAVCAAGGLLLGHLWPSRFLPPLLAIAVGFLIVGPTGIQQLERVKMLSPMGAIDSVVREPLIKVDERIMQPHLLWLGALGLALVFGLVVLRRGGWVARVLLVVAVVGAVLAANPLMDYRSRQWGEYSGLAYEPIPYEPACATKKVTVCVHPAYESILAESVSAVELITVPLAGIDRLPTRYEQTITGHRSDDVIWFYIWGADHVGITLGHQVPNDLVTDWEEMDKRVDANGFGGWQTAAQAIVAAWLTQEYQQAARLPEDMLFHQTTGDGRMSRVPVWSVAEGAPFDGCPPPSAIQDQQFTQCVPDEAGAAAFQTTLDAATERFLALDPAVRRAWLEANWVDLRTGLLTLEDMP